MSKATKTPMGLFGNSLKLGLLAFSLAWVHHAESQPPLELEMALPLEGDEILQPSGLALADGQLYLVSAKHDDQIFSVQLGQDRAEYKEALKITRPDDASSLKLVWRGIAGDGHGQWLLISETAYRVLKVDKGGKSEWMGPSVLDAGTEIGLFGGDHSGPDGLACLGENSLLIGASREPRGLIAMQLSGEKVKIEPMKCDSSKTKVQVGRKADFTDLDFSGHTLFALVGSADAVCSLKKREDGKITEDQCWSYAATAQDPKYRYRGLKGIGRGLASDQGRLYVVLDNKGLAREADPKDRRPLLLVFKRPAASHP